MNDNQTYLVCTIKSWNIEAFKTQTPKFPGQWHIITEKDALTLEAVKALNPRYIFFPHWSWFVPKEILETFECVCFHMTDVPYGRGGSPLQNLILRGHKDTKLTALRMTDVMDAGPVYMKRDLSLSGRADEIYKRAGDMSFNLIKEIIETTPTPTPQSGEVTRFKRRTPEMSQIPADASPELIYDYIRMLDAEGYPNAFIPHGEGFLSFTEATLTKEGQVTANARFIKKVEE
jgi:methionyl-tRNA formyltransferase